MVPITIVNGVYKQSYNWGAPPCTNPIRATLCQLNGNSIGLALEDPWMRGLCIPIYLAEFNHT